MRHRHHKAAQLSGVRTAGKGTEFLTYKLTDVLVTSLQQGDSAGGDLPLEQFSLGYTTIEMTFRPQSAKGEPGPPETAGFDLKHNKKL